MDRQLAEIAEAIAERGGITLSQLMARLGMTTAEFRRRYYILRKMAGADGPEGIEAWWKAQKERT